MVDTAKTEEQQAKAERASFFRRTRLYLLEYVLYHSFVIILLCYIAYTFYALFGVIAGKHLSVGLVEASVWFMAGSFVFIPLTYIVYTRTRWEEIRHPARFKQPLRVAITYIQLIIGLMGGITFALIMFINLIRFIVGLTDASSLLTLVAPSAIMTVITAVVVFDILSKASRRGLRVFRPIFFSICVLATVILLALTAIFGRSGAYDRQTMRDLVLINEKVRENNDGGSLETDISKLNLSDDVVSRASERNYEIKADNSTSSQTSLYSYNARRKGYELCATFRSSSSPEAANRTTYSSSYIGVNTAHPAGYHCFKLVTY